MSPCVWGHGESLAECALLGLMRPSLADLPPARVKSAMQILPQGCFRPEQFQILHRHTVLTVQCNCSNYISNCVILLALQLSSLETKIIMLERMIDVQLIFIYKLYMYHVHTCIHMHIKLMSWSTWLTGNVWETLKAALMMAAKLVAANPKLRLQGWLAS